MKAKREATWLQHREETTNAAQHPGQEGLKEWESWPFLAIRLKYVLWLAKIAHSTQSFLWPGDFGQANHDVCYDQFAR